MENRTAQKKRHNKKSYRSILFRVRKGTELDTLLEEHAEHGETSVNFLISIALCNFLKCKLPHREYTRIRRKRMI
jgi:hypothetical protein